MAFKFSKSDLENYLDEVMTDQAPAKQVTAAPGTGDALLGIRQAITKRQNAAGLPQMPGAGKLGESPPMAGLPRVPLANMRR